MRHVSTGKIFAALLLALDCLASAEVVINEIMYRPASESAREEFVELLNTGRTPVNLAGWRFTRGIRFEFLDIVLTSGDYLVVAADPEAFRAKYPGVTNIAGLWRGALSNSGDELRLEDAVGKTVDAVRYADEGDWGLRMRGPVDFNHRGWIWTSPADGNGSSLELANPSLPNQFGQNWAASRTVNGTPGRANSVLTANAPPLILDVQHTPVVPRSTNTVTITARVLDENSSGLEVWLRHRLDGAPTFAASPMSDDGAHGEGRAGDGTFGATLPALPHNTVVEFYIEASDRAGLIRTWPAPALVDGLSAQIANCLYQVDDLNTKSAQPLYRIIMKETDRAELADLGRRFPDGNSDAEMNATFISIDSSGDTEVRYGVGVRNRGHGSRFRQPNSYRVNFRSDERWQDVAALNLNGINPHAQVLGSALFLLADVPAAPARAVQVRVNNANLAAGVPFSAPWLDAYAAVQVLDRDFADEFFPHDSSGNIYRGQRIVLPGANLAFLGEDPGLYRTNYFKRTNTAQDDWRDLIELTSVLSTNTPDASYSAEVNRLIDADEWLRYFAVNALLDNNETTLATGDGDDYYLYRGTGPQRFVLIPHDLDTILGIGDLRASPTNGIFRSLAVPAIERLLKHPEFAPRFYGVMRELISTTFSSESINMLGSQLLSSWVPAEELERVKNFVSARNAFVLSLIPGRLGIEHDLAAREGYWHSTNSAISLRGFADATKTRSIRVNGQSAGWSAWDARWTNNAVALMPGINRVLVQAFDAGGAEFERTVLDVWFESNQVTPVSGTVAGNAVWPAARGPYLIDGNVTVAAGVTLQIEAGATLFFTPQSGFTINGQLLAEGTDNARIHFTKPPGSAQNWGNVAFVNTPEESRLSFVDFDFSGAGRQTILALNANLILDHCTFTNSPSQYVTLENSSFVIRHCEFPDTHNVELIHGFGLPPEGRGIFEGNRFGTTTGLADIIDFTGGQRPDAILQFYDNVFTGGSDDILDLDGTDAHIEGNIFMNCHQTASLVDSSSAISGGRFGTNTSRLTIVRNLFYDCDHLALAKEGNFYTIAHNTALKLTKAAVVFDEPERRGQGVTPGRGADLEGNIFWDTPRNFEHAYVDNAEFGTTEISMSRCVSSASDFLTNGLGNILSDPRLNFTDPAKISPATIREAFVLRPNSPAIGVGPNGLDIGALVPAGASISGEPNEIANATDATLTVGGPGIESFRFRANEGEFSSELPVSVPILLTNLANGAYTVSVVGRNSAGVWQDATKPTLSRSWQVDLNLARLVINEILVENVSSFALAGRFPSMIELFNASAAALDLSGVSLSDDRNEPRKFVIRPGTRIEAGGYFVLVADRSPSGNSVLATGFPLASSGGALFLFDKPEKGGGLLDSISFGLQIPNYSIGRLNDGRWRLTRPTPGAPNVAARLGDPASIVLNEWLALPARGDDWIEIFNPGEFPVELGGLFLTDNFIDPTRHQIAPLSFIGTGGNAFARFEADGSPEKGVNHLNFKLAGDGEMLGLSDATGRPIDRALFSAQTVGVSEGRVPADKRALARLQPTPGRQNRFPSQLALDSDGDGMEDSWETSNGFDPQDARDAALDADGDGADNLSEFLARTNPRDPPGELRIKAAFVQGGQLVLEFAAMQGRDYSVFASRDVPGGLWEKVATASKSETTGPNSVKVPLPADAGERFYRLLLEPIR